MWCKTKEWLIDLWHKIKGTQKRTKLELQIIEEIKEYQQSNLEHLLNSYSFLKKENENETCKSKKADG